MNFIKSRFLRYSGCLVVVSMSLLFFSCQTTLPTASSLREQQLETVQGITDEFVSFSEAGVFGRVTHNDSLMMVQLKIQDDPVMMRLLMMGLTIWVDPAASREQEVGVVFPGAGPVLRQRPVGSDRFPAREQAPDSIIPFNPRPLLDIVTQRNMVFRQGGKAEFIKNGMARIYLDDQGHLNYIMKISFAQLDISDPEQARVSVGVVSEVPVFQMDDPGRQSSTGGRRGQPVTPYPRYGSARQRQSLEPINQWIIFDFSAQDPEIR